MYESTQESMNWAVCSVKDDTKASLPDLISGQLVPVTVYSGSKQLWLETVVSLLALTLNLWDNLSLQACACAENRNSVSKAALRKKGTDCSRFCWDRTWGNGLKLKGARLRLATRGKFVTLSVVMLWNRLPRGGGGCPVAGGRAGWGSE